MLSQNREARYKQQQSLSEVEAAERGAVKLTRQAYNNVVSGVSKIKAGRQAIKSNETSLKSTEAAFKVGTRTIVDVLLAQKNLFQAQKIHAQDQYNYINSLLALKQAAGTLAIEDLEQVNRWLK